MGHSKQSSFIQESNNRIFVLAADSSPLEIYTAEDHQCWIRYIDLYYLFGLDLEIEFRDGLDFFLSLPESERADCEDVALVSLAGMVLLAAQSPVNKIQMSVARLILLGFEQLTQIQGFERGFNDYWASLTTKPKTPKSKNRHGYVYLIRSISGHYKIGRALKPDDRIETFGIKLPFEVEFVHTIECGDYITAERELHLRYEAQRVNGEWFALTEDDVVAIKAIHEM